MKRTFTKQILFTKSIIAAAFLSFFIFAGTSTAQAAFNNQVNYQGRLTAPSGVAVPNGSYNVRFKLYTAPVSATTSAIWTETECYSPDSGTTCNGSGVDGRVTITNGLFSVMLGSTTSLTNINLNQTLYLGVEIGASSTAPAWDGEMSPRKILGSVPAAMYSGTSSVASTLNGITAGQFVRNDIQNATSTATTFLSVLQSGAGKIAEFFGSAAQSVLSLLSNGNVGVGSSTPSANLSVHSTNGNSATSSIFVIASSTPSGTGTTTLLTVLGNGNLGVGSSTPGLPLSVTGAAYIGGNVMAGGALSVFGSTTLATSLNGFLQATNGLVSATTSPSLSSLSGVLGIANGGTNSSGQFTNALMYFDGTRITGGSNFTYTGTTLSFLGSTSTGASAATFSNINGGGGGSTIKVTNLSGTVDSLALFQNLGSGPAAVFTGGNVGIGTTSPSNRLEVSGNGYFSGNVTGSYYTATSTTATSTFGGSVTIGNTGVTASPSGNNFAFGSSHDLSSPITSSGFGSLAFGYTNNAGNSPSIVSSGHGSFAGGTANGLAGSGSILSSNTGSFAFGYSSTGTGINSTGAGSIAMGYAFSGNLSATGNGSVALGQDVNATANNAFALGNGFTNSTASTFQVGFTATPTLTVNSTNVGIGTTSPSNRLEVSGNGYFSGNITGANITATGTLAVTSTTTTGGLSIGSLSGLLWGTSGAVSAVSTSSLGLASSVSLSALTASLTNGFNARWNGSSFINSLFRDNGTVTGINATTSTSTFLVQGTSGIDPFDVASSSGAMLFSITGSGNVGIGTTTPVSTLSVVGNASIGIGAVSATGNQGSIALGNAQGYTINSSGLGSLAGGYAVSGNITASNYASFAWGNNVNATGRISTAFGAGFTNSTDSTFQVGYSATPTFTVTASSVGIGTTSPSNRLEVAGNSYFGGNVTATGTLSVTSTTTTGGLSVASLNGLLFATNGAVTQLATSSLNLATLTAANSTLTLAGGYNGSTTRTIGLNLANPNTWTTQQNFNINGSSGTGAIAIVNTSAGSNTGFFNIIGSVGAEAAGTAVGDFLIHSTDGGSGANQIDFSASKSVDMAIKTNGFIGIGTTSPSNRLEVSGNGYFTGNLTGANIIATGTLAVSGGTTLANATTTSLAITGLSNTVLAVNSLGQVIATTSSAVNFFSNSGATTTLNTGSILTATNGTFGTINATSSLNVTGTTTTSGLSVASLSGLLWGTNGAISAVSTSSLGLASSVSLSALTASLTNGFNARWNGSSFINSLFRDNGTVSGINATTSTSTFLVQGTSGIDPFDVASSSGAMLFSITGSGNVGIGSSTPSSLLTVSGNGYFGGNLTATGTLTVLGTASSTFSGSINSASGNLVLQSNGTTNNVLLNPYGGNVGLGATSPQANLHIKETAGIGMTIERPANCGTYGFNNTGNARFLMNVDTNNNPSMEFHHGTAGCTQGTALYEDWAWTNNADYDFRWIMQAATALTTTGSAVMQLNNGNGTSVLRVGPSITTSASTVDIGGNLSIGSYGGVNAAPSNGLIVSGNVGIGTATAAQKLDVNGILTLQDGGARTYPAGLATELNSQIIDFGINDASLNRFGTYTSGTQGGFIAIDTRAGSNLYHFWGRAAGSTNNTGNELMSITSSGFVGIGTTTLSNRLEVSGNTFLGGNLTATGTLAVSGATTLASSLNGFLQATNGLVSATSGPSITALTGILTPDHGGTGINNGASTITLAGNLTTSGANPLTFTTSGSTNVTLPTTGTLVNSAVATLSSLTSIGTLGTLTVSGQTTLGNASSSNFTSNGFLNVTSTTTTGGLSVASLSGLLWGTNGAVSAVSTSSLGLASSVSLSALTASLSNGFDAAWNGTSFINSLFRDNGTVTGINATTSTSTFLVQGTSGINPFSVASSSGANLFNILANGNVGIGTTTPSNRFEVSGNTFLGGNLTATGTLAVGSSVTSSNNSFALGNAGPAFPIIASGVGSIAAGNTGGASGSGGITASGPGSFAMGYAVGSGGGTISATSSGSFAFGVSNGSSNSITSGGLGSVAMGYTNGGVITANGNGALALGYSTSGLTSTGIGSVALGQDVNATANNAFALGYRINNSTASTFKVGFNATPTLTVTASNVGIGSTSPTTLFVANGTSTMQNIIPMGPYTGNMSTYNLGASTTRWSSVWAQNVNIGTSTWSLAQSGDGRFGIFNAPNAGGTEALSILTNGNMGIGTTSPSNRLEVSGNTFLGGSLTATGTISFSNKAAFLPGDTYGMTSITDPNNGATTAGVIYPPVSGRRFYLGTSGQQFYSLNLSNLQTGIEGLAALTTPIVNVADSNQSIHSGGGQQLQEDAYWAIVLRGNHQTGGTNTNVLTDSAGSAGVLIPSQQTTAPALKVYGAGGQTANIMEIASSSNSALSVFNKDGWLGIGTTTPTNKLTIQGAGNTSATAAFNVTGADGGPHFFVRDDGNVGIGTTTPSNNFVATGTIQFNSLGAGTVTTDANGKLVITSDERLKNIQGTFNTGLDAILSLNPIVYKWNQLSGNDTGTTYAGFSAQNVQGVIPEAIGHTPDGYLTLQDRPIEAALVNSVKQLNFNLNTLASSTVSTASNLSTSTADLAFQIAGINAKMNSLASSTTFITGLASSTAATVATIASSTATTLETSSTFIQAVAFAVSEILKASGTWVSNQVTAVVGTFGKVIAGRVETQTAAVTNGLEMTDSSTGQIYCVRITNGDFAKVLGSCGASATSTSPIAATTTPTIPVTTIIPTDSGTTTATTSTPTASTTTSTASTTTQFIIVPVATTTPVTTPVVTSPTDGSTTTQNPVVSPAETPSSTPDSGTPTAPVVPPTPPTPPADSSTPASNSGAVSGN